MVKAGEAAGDTIIMVEIDPREGSGVIPNDWTAFLQVKGRPERVVRGRVEPRLRDVPALAGVLRRNYDYDRFWMVFPLQTDDGQPSSGATTSRSNSWSASMTMRDASPGVFRTWSDQSKSDWFAPLLPPGRWMPWKRQGAV